MTFPLTIVNFNHFFIQPAPGEYDACDVTLSIYPQRASLKNMPNHGGNQTLLNSVAELPEHWSCIPKVVGSIPAVVRHIFQACPVWIYTQSNITSIIYTIEIIDIECVLDHDSRIMSPLFLMRALINPPC